MHRNVIPLTKTAPETVCIQSGLRELCLPFGLSEDEVARLDSLVTTRKKLKRGCVMVNNLVYALTKGQTSPTTPYLQRGEGTFLSLKYYPPVDPILDMVSYSVSTKASFIAQGIATDPSHLAWLLEEAVKHKGFSFVSVLAPCVTFTPPGLFQTIRERATYLKEGEPVELPTPWTEQPWLHDSSNITLALKLAQSPVGEKPHIGIIFRGRGA